MAVEGFAGNKQPVDVKVGELTPQSRAVNVLAKVVSKSEIRNITAGRDGEAHKVSDALVGDETGSIYLTLWDDNIEKVKEEDTINVKNGYINLFRGNMRLNIGRYGTLGISEQPLAGAVNTENNVSTKVYEEQRRPFRGGGRDYGGRGGEGGRGGYGGRGDSGGRDRRGGGGYGQRRY
ncbi:OB-fold nucleic acid binding domain-containing protein [Candidatus Bathyarchaeota archaeon]|nr:OB-fold nucleic acid binding domain-containing protein [Candidatus Bathyarchaeota archaeon]